MTAEFGPLGYRLRTAADRQARTIEAAAHTDGVVVRTWGTVTALHAAPTAADAPWASIDVAVHGTPMLHVRYLAAYSPTVDDIVIVDVVGTDPICMGVLK